MNKGLLKTPNAGKNWTDEDTIHMLNLYYTECRRIKYIADMLNRSENAVRCRLFLIRAGIIKSHFNYVKRYTRR